jgi:hypothetical protein
MPRSTVLDEIEALDPVADHERIVFLTTCFEFPFDTTRALEFALFRTYCVPSISALLVRTGEFEARPQKRYDDTDIIISEILEHGHSSPRARRAIARMNAIHGRFKISNDDYLYVLSTFIFEPIRWIDRFGWRQLTPGERQAMFQFWCAVGQAMNITGIPESYAAFEALNRDYERENYRFKESNRRIGAATVELFAGWFAKPLAPLVRRAVYALLDDPLIEAFGFPKASPFMRWAVPGLVRLRGRLAGYLPRRGSARRRSDMTRASYPQGHTIERVGPP